MVDKKNEPIKRKFRKFLGYAACILIVILLVSTIKNIERVISIRKQVNTEKMKVDKMQADNAKLQAQIAEAQSQNFIDKQIRNKLGLTKVGEVMVVLPDESVVRSLAPQESTDEEALPDPNWVKWKKLFLQ